MHPRFFDDFPTEIAGFAYYPAELDGEIAEQKYLFWTCHPINHRHPQLTGCYRRCCFTYLEGHVKPSLEHLQLESDYDSTLATLVGDLADHGDLLHVRELTNVSVKHASRELYGLRVMANASRDSFHISF